MKISYFTYLGRSVQHMNAQTRSSNNQATLNSMAVTKSLSAIFLSRAYLPAA